MDIPYVALPPDLRSALQDEWERDRGDLSPISISNEDGLGIYLELLAPDHLKWGALNPESGEEFFPGSKPVESLFAELRANEARLSVVTWQGQRYILRDIRTAAITVLHNYHDPKDGQPYHRTAVWLREYHLRNGQQVWRRHRNSMSEKLIEGESFRDAAIRAVHQELSLEPTAIYFEKPYLFEMDSFPGVIMPADQERSNDAFIYKPDVRHTPRYPGILTRNRIGVFYWAMPERFFNPSGYHEEDTEHYFVWVPVTQNA